MDYDSLKATWAKRRERIRKLAQTVPQKELARRFNLSESRISRIVGSGKVRAA